MLATPTTVNILLVDDKSENLFALEELLQRPDRVIYKARSGNDALRALLKHEFALVLLDVEMPDMDGYECAQLMRSAERTRLIPIIFVTAGDRSEERTFRGYEAGAVDFLYKPINSHTLASKVAIFLELYRTNQALVSTTAALQDRIDDLEYVHKTLSHDLRAPLRSIRAFSEVVVETQRDRLDAQGLDALDRVVRAATRMTAMIEDLYAVLKFTSEEAHVSNVDVTAVLHDVIENLRSDVERVGAKVTYAAMPTLRTTRRLLVQILQNLIANAISFAGKDPLVIEVSAVRRSNAWELTVRDNGVGIPAADRERLFKLFSRLDDARSGSGVGLALCKRAVEKLGGRIWLATDGGPGAAFSFTLPDLPDAPETSQATQATQKK
jgi:two-component system, sensor histidine kinase and response regulator